MAVRHCLLMAVLLVVCGCAGTGGLGSVAHTKELAPGMTPAQVKDILGEPSQVQFIANRYVWKYALHQPWKGWVPYYLVFEGEPQQLRAWFTDEAEYARQQALWLQAFPPPR